MELRKNTEIKRPLEAIRVLDLSQMIAGPYGSQILGDLGAEVIKVEPPNGEAMRHGAGYSIQGERAVFLSFNRNKKGIVLNLKHEEGRKVFYDLVKISDVVYDNFRAGVLEKLYLDFDHLKVYNPLIISCSITGFGEEGPYRDRPAYDLIVQAIAGAMSITGEEGRPPVRIGISIADHAAGMFGAIGILTGLIARNATGEGQRINTSLLDGMVSLLSYEGMICLASGEIPGPRGSGHISNVPYQAFQTKDAYIAVVIRGNDFWKELCEALKIEELGRDPRFAAPTERLRNKHLIVEKLQEIFRTKTTKEWEDILIQKDVPCGPVNTLDKTLTDPQVIARRMVVESTNQKENPIKFLGNPIKVAALPCEQYDYPPKLGEHTEEVLCRLLGYSQGRISDLRKSGIIK